MQQARHRGRAIWAQPNCTLLGGSCYGAYVRAGADKCFVVQTPVCAHCTSLRNPRGQCLAEPPASATLDSGSPDVVVAPAATYGGSGGGGTLYFCMLPNPLFFLRLSQCTTYVVLRCTFVVSYLLTFGAVPAYQTDNLRLVPFRPPPALSERPAAAPQRKFWLPVVVQHALTLAVPRSLLPPWLFCRRALLTLSGSSMRTSLTAAMKTSSLISGTALRRWGQRPCRTAKMDWGRWGRNR